jgi:hypothetical protein
MKRKTPRKEMEEEMKNGRRLNCGAPLIPSAFSFLGVFSFFFSWCLGVLVVNPCFVFPIREAL